MQRDFTSWVCASVMALIVVLLRVRIPRHNAQWGNTMGDASKTPTHRIYTLVPRKGSDGEEAKPFWLSIGSLWPHVDGKGWSCQLEALQLHGDGQLVIRELKEPAPEAPKPKYGKK